MGTRIELAQEARNLGEVPVGALVVRSGRILAQAHNLRETLERSDGSCRTAGPDLGRPIARHMAARGLRALRHARALRHVRRRDRPVADQASWSMARLDPKAGGCAEPLRVVSDPRLNHRCQITAGVLAKSAAKSSKNSSRNAGHFVKCETDVTRARRAIGSKPGSATATRRGA